LLTWLELDKQFHELGQIYVRLDYQWGDAGTNYRLAGPVTAASQRFEALAQIAGMKLSELPADALHAGVMQRDAADERWYEALRYYSKAFEDYMPGTLHDPDDGTFRGNVYMGHIQAPVEASSVVALRLSVVAPAPPAVIVPPPETAGLGSGLNAWLHSEAEKRGKLWAVGGIILGLVLGALALL
jgi:hypothetical protein